jgi:citrate synthase
MAAPMRVGALALRGSLTASTSFAVRRAGYRYYSSAKVKVLLPDS